VFSALKSIGSYVEGSGIDQLWVETGMFSPTTVRQVLEGKHLYRAMEAHMVTLMALYFIFFQTLWANAPEDKTGIEEASAELNEEFRNWKASSRLPEAHAKLVSALEKSSILWKMEKYDEHASGMARFLRNYVKQFECILHFVRASRQGQWDLHLAAHEELAKYFFAHDHLNYARLSPVYVAE